MIKSLLFGVAVGDAMGVPVEFTPRNELDINPVTTMTGYGTYDVPAGAFSDDSSLTFCLAEAMTVDFDIKNIEKNFIAWKKDAYWTATGEVFDIGVQTLKSIYALENGYRRSDFDITSNGNGSLMRISPLVFHLMNKPILDRFEIVKEVSSITHGHIISVISCFYYLEYLRELLNGSDCFTAYINTNALVESYLKSRLIGDDVINLFSNLLNGNMPTVGRNQINSSGYVIDTLEASMWSILTTTNYEDAILTAVNLGNDTDTTAAVTGGLAGVIYGYDTIPTAWVSTLLRAHDIEVLSSSMERHSN